MPELRLDIGRKEPSLRRELEPLRLLLLRGVRAEEGEKPEMSAAEAQLGFGRERNFESEPKFESALNY